MINSHGIFSKKSINEILLQERKRSFRAEMIYNWNLWIYALKACVRNRHLLAKAESQIMCRSRHWRKAMDTVDTSWLQQLSRHASILYKNRVDIGVPTADCGAPRNLRWCFPCNTLLMKTKKKGQHDPIVHLQVQHMHALGKLIRLSHNGHLSPLYMSDCWNTHLSLVQGSWAPTFLLAPQPQ